MAGDLISEINELNRSHVHIKDRHSVNEKLSGIINDNFSNLQVLSDFDMTITKQHENGKKHMSSISMFEHCPSVTDKYVQRTQSLSNKFRPLEYDPDIPADVKLKHMEKWWAESEMALKGEKVPQKEIEEVVAKLGTSLRDGSEELFKTLSENDVPVLVFSAGLGDVVMSVLKHFNVLLPNVEVVSNFLKYDCNGTITGFKGPLIHVLNKNEYAIKDSKYYDVVKDRHNVILLGDSLGDAKMSDGITEAKHVLKIGFIYEKVEGNLPAYLDVFDIVLEDDQSMDIPRAIIKLMSK